jgi:peptide chain release factor 1
MKPSLKTKLQEISLKVEEIGYLLSDPDVIADQKKFLRLSKEYSQLREVSSDYEKMVELEAELAGARELMQDGSDPVMSEMISSEIEALTQEQMTQEKKLLAHLVPKDPQDGSNVFLEVRAGTGGDEAALFAGSLFKMYVKYAETKGWSVEILSQSDGDHGGFKEIIARIDGSSVFGHLKFESGAHRVQRVPQTESQGRIHTSACTVAIIPEITKESSFELDKKDLRIDTYRASGAGGQHVNKTDSAIRITHLPTGTVVECQDERSQHKNRAKAMSLLLSRINDERDREKNAQNASLRKSLVGTGDRSDRIRSYNFPEGRVTDHRIDLKVHRLGEVMMGDIDLLIRPLIDQHVAMQLLQIAQENE